MATPTILSLLITWTLFSTRSWAVITWPHRSFLHPRFGLLSLSLSHVYSSFFSFYTLFSLVCVSLSIIALMSKDLLCHPPPQPIQPTSSPNKQTKWGVGLTVECLSLDARLVYRCIYIYLVVVQYGTVRSLLPLLGHLDTPGVVTGAPLGGVFDVFHLYLSRY
jgi:hypothetical protein